MINTISYEEAVANCPAIVADKPSKRASEKYSFVSTDKIVRSAMNAGWKIREVRPGRGPLDAHKVSMVHELFLKKSLTDQDGLPQLNIINSHNLTKKLSIPIGYYRLACSNGLIVPTGITAGVGSQIHRAECFDLSKFNESIDNTLNFMGALMENIDQMKDRSLETEEAMALSKFAHYIRFRYRMVQPKKTDTSALLKPNRKGDEGNDLWKVLNTIQENVTKGGSQIGKGITQFHEDLRFNQELWAGASSAMEYRGSQLSNHLENLFRKTERQKRSLLTLNEKVESLTIE